MVSSGSPGEPGASSGVAGGPAGSGQASRGRPVRGVATTDAPLRPPRQVRPPPGRRQAAARGGRRWPRGKVVRPCGRAARRGRGWREARPCRRGSPTGADAGWSRAVTSCAPAPLPGVEAAGPDAGRRGGLACRPGPQASTRDCARQVKSAGRGAAGPEQATQKMDRPLPGHPERGVAAAAAGRQRLVVVDGSVMSGWLRVPPRCALTLHKSGFQGLFSPAPRK
jgi:hypothetical protein